MFNPNTDGIKDKSKVHDTRAKKLLADIPSRSIYTHSMQKKISLHEKQLVEVQSIIHHKETRQLLTHNPFSNLEEKKHFVIKRIARKLWTNFCVQGQDTPTLRYLHSIIKSEHKKKLYFRYPNKNTELIIMEKKADHLEPVSRLDHIDAINRAWQASQEIVSDYID